MPLLMAREAAVSHLHATAAAAIELDCTKTEEYCDVCVVCVMECAWWCAAVLYVHG